MRIQILVILAIIGSFSSGVKGQKFNPEFLEMLKSVLSKLKVGKHELDSLGEVGSLLQEDSTPTPMEQATSTFIPAYPYPVSQDPHEDYCEKQSQSAFQNFCRTPGMLPGHYVDPWDPYCGYIICHPEGNATRHFCGKGSWTGFKATSSGRQAMCRVQLKVGKRHGSCFMATFNNEMCRKAEWVVEYNSALEEI